ncbi:hypothetical protein BSU04_20680 [Caballeronia sordidicola]|uniref:Uncharacterized protein n=1 Tax=Caballeronia sordidicola TaxID=196367 RepID=A0A226WZQ8_CABSO|nr:hypothetical protein BSU04_20680 [Caballeronia sordidicola]
METQKPMGRSAALKEPRLTDRLSYEECSILFANFEGMAT